MSDLQCAATVVVLAAGADVDPARLAGWRVALVYADGSPGTTALAARLAGELGVGARPVAAAGLDGVLDELADEHRGECVVLVAAEDSVTDLSRRDGRRGPAVVVELDSDGRRVSALPTGR